MACRGLVAGGVVAAMVFAACGEARDLIGEIVDHGAGHGGDGGHGGGATGVAPRPVAPLSGGVIAAARPTFRWQLGAGTDGAQIDICQDRACAQTVTTFAATGTEGLAPAALAPGLYYWRAAGTKHGRVNSAVGPTWELWTRGQPAELTGSWGTRTDVDGDGFVDLVAERTVYRGSAAGIVVASGRTFGGDALYPAGDVNGDGYSDLARVTLPGVTFGTITVDVILGGATGPDAAHTLSASFEGVSLLLQVEPMGDVNRDGFGDVLVRHRAGVVLLYGGAGALTVGAVAPPDVFSQGGDAVDGDVNGDGFADIAAWGAGPPDVLLTLGTAAGIGATAHQALTAPEHFASAFQGRFADVNHDGRADLAVWSNFSALLLYTGTADGLTAAPVQTVFAPQTVFYSAVPAMFGDFNGDQQEDWAAAGPDAINVSYGAGGRLGTDVTAVRIGGTVGDLDLPFAVGDFNHDGFDDVAVHSRDVGVTYVFFGGAGGFDAAAPPRQTLPANP